jgi:hypothetical protein
MTVAGWIGIRIKPIMIKRNPTRYFVDITPPVNDLKQQEKL